MSHNNTTTTTTTSTNGHHHHHPAQVQTAHCSRKSPSEMEEFDDTFQEIVDVLTRRGFKDDESCWGFHWLKKVLEYNVPYGKKNRGISVVSTYKRFVKDPSKENLKIANVLGWCVELFQAYFLVTDDIMDKSITRRGKPCWYKNKEVGLIAVNDSYFIEGCIYQLLKEFIRDQPYYMDVTELFLQMGFHTVIGQCLDMTTAPPESQVDFTHFTADKYAAIVKWKTAFYSFYLPVAIAMHMAGVSDEESLKQAETILLKIGHFFQVQDDYLDCYGSPEVIGKVGTDIQDNKCGWLIVTALGMASEEQKTELENHYGRWDNACVQRVKDIYRDLDLEGVFKKYEESSYQELTTAINTTLTHTNSPREIFTDFMEKIYKRTK